MKSNRYIIAFAGVILHLMLGSTYAWSVYRNPIIEKTGWDQASVAFAFSLAIFCLGLFGCIYGAFGRKIWSESHGESICFSIRRWKYLNRICNRPSGAVVAVSRLWHFRWAWFGSRLYYPCVNDYKMVS